MSLVFSTLVIALFVVMPGFFLDHSISSGKLNRARPQTAVVTDIAIYVAFAIPVHLVTAVVLRYFGLLRAGIDYRLFLSALTGDFSKPQASLDQLAGALTGDKARIAGYLVSTILVAVVLGWVVQYLLLRTPLKRMVPLQNPWFNTFFLPNWERVSQCQAYVLTKAEAWQSPILYQGFVTDFRSDREGALAEIRLRKPQRRPLASSSSSPLQPLNWTPLEQELLIIPAPEIANTALSYIRIWRPYAILGRAAITIAPGENRTIRLKPNILSLLLGRSNGLYKLAGEEVKAEAGPHGSVNVELQATGSTEARVELVGVKRMQVDSLSSNTGNPLFWLEQRIMNWLTDRIEARAAVPLLKGQVVA